MKESDNNSSKIIVDNKALSKAIEDYEGKIIEYAKLRDKNFLSSEE